MSEEIPEVGEIIVCKVTRVLDYGVFVELLEYNNMKGFVHVSQVASRWVKNIRNFAKEGQLRAAKVISVVPEKQQVDLSLTKVYPNVQRAKIEEYKQFKRNKKLLEILASEQKKSFDEVWEIVAEPLIDEYGSLFDAFQKIAIQGKGAAQMLDSKWAPLVVEIIQKNVTVSKKTIKGILTIQCLQPNGVEVIKDSLIAGMNSTKDADVEIYYVGPGKHVIKVTSTDFKVAERVLKFVSNNIIESIKSSKGTASN